MIVTLLRKPLTGGILNTLPCAGLNIDACRRGVSKRVPGVYSKAGARNVFGVYGATKIDQSGQNPLIGRFPTNLIVHVMVSGVFPEAVSLRRNDTGHIVRSTWGHSRVSCQDGTLSASRYFKGIK